jgi:hypothetical protein
VRAGTDGLAKGGSGERRNNGKCSKHDNEERERTFGYILIGWSRSGFYTRVGCHVARTLGMV